MGKDEWQSIKCVEGRAWLLERSLREGCSTLPILFNVYHQAVMRQAEEQQRSVNKAPGIVWKWLQEARLRVKVREEKVCSEAREI